MSEKKPLRARKIPAYQLPRDMQGRVIGGRRFRIKKIFETYGENINDIAVLTKEDTLKEWLTYLTVRIESFPVRERITCMITACRWMGKTVRFPHPSTTALPPQITEMSVAEGVVHEVLPSRTGKPGSTQKRNGCRPYDVTGEVFDLMVRYKDRRGIDTVDRITNTQATLVS